MHFQLSLVASQPHTLIPFNYPYLLTGWLYRVLQGADAQYTTFLHQRGYRTERKTFRLFTFSDLRLKHYEVRTHQGGFLLLSPEVELTLSFYVDRAAEAFVTGLFGQQTVVLANRQQRAELVVAQVATQPTHPVGDRVTLRTLSPVVVAQRDETGMDQYLHPADANYGPLLLRNLIDKHRSTREEARPAALDPEWQLPEWQLPEWQLPEWQLPEAFSYRLLTPPQRVRSRLVTIKEGAREETKVRGWYGFDFELTGPAEVLEVGLLAGVGRYNAEGFGCVEAVT